ncbi:hypothetical protein LBMAG27_00770 [Bacteroidota bacterium]|nr:hypothetical protein LBMAG27_00770 [Bacteroidota bacterium]
MNWYSERGEKTEQNLYNDVYAVLKHIQNFPENFSMIQKNYRQAVLGRFPYVIVYKIYRTEISVYSLFHTSRNSRKKIRRK